PSVVVLRGTELVDVSAAAPTVRDLCEAPEPAGLARDVAGEPVAPLAEVLANTPRDRRDPAKPWLLAPTDLQAVKPAGVTFAVSAEEAVPQPAVHATTPRNRRDPARPWLLAPTELRAVTAGGVAFAVSMLERVIEEQARGALEKAAAIRAEMSGAIGDDLARL